MKNLIYILNLSSTARNTSTHDAKVYRGSKFHLSKSKLFKIVSNLFFNSLIVVAKEIKDCEERLKVSTAKFLKDCHVGDIRVSYRYHNPKLISVLA